MIWQQTMDELRRHRNGASLMKFIIIGMVCNVAHCYWTPTNKTSYDDLAVCTIAASDLKRDSIMYFQTACMVRE